MPKSIIMIIILFFNAFFMAANADDTLPLPVEQAFAFSVHMENPRKLIAEWHVAPGYFLYKDKLRISVVTPSALSAHVGTVGWPAATMKKDTTHGNYPAYEGTVRVAIPLSNASHQPFTLAVQYQGCSEEGFCYPPMKKSLNLAFPFATEGLSNAPLLTISDTYQMQQAEKPAALTSSTLLTDQAAAQAFLGGHTFIVTLLCFLGLGLLLAFTPCSLPMIPILSSIIVGEKNVTTSKAFYLSLTYVLGMAMTYAIAGIAITWMGSSVQIYFQNPWIITAFSLLFVLLALSMLGMFTLRFSGKWQQRIMGWSQRQKGGTYISSLLMGMLATLIVSPCVTAPLVGVLAYVTETGNILLGGSALFALGLGMGIPLLLLGFSAGKYLPKTGPWMETIKTLFAALLLGMAVWMMSRILPGGVTLFLWSCLVLSAAMYIFFFMEELSSKWRYLAYGTGTVLLLYGFVLFIGVSLGYEEPFYPLQKLYVAANPAAAAAHFVEVKNMDEMNQVLQQAKQENKPVILDFFAEWCASCLQMEKTVLSQPEIQQVLQHFVLVRANVTANNAFDQALFKRYGVVAPPTFIFFNRDGQEVKDQRIVGEVDHQSFLARAIVI